LSVIKDAYFQTLQAVKALVPIEKYDELKRNLCRDSVTYLALSLMLCGFILQLCYEFYLGYKLGFWSENIPIWSGLRYGPISFLFMGVPVMLGFLFFVDIINEAYSWCYLPVAIRSSVDKIMMIDPDIFGNVEEFDKFNKSLLRITLLLITLSALAGPLLFITPPGPVAYMGYTILLLIFIPYLFMSRLRGLAIKEIIAKLEKEVEQGEKKGDDPLGTAQVAEKLSEFLKGDEQTDESYQKILVAAINYEMAGEYEKAAQNYSLAGKHWESAEAYKKQSQKEENEELRRFYKACHYSELSEGLWTVHKRDEAYKNLYWASNIFEQLERSAKDDKFLAHSSLYRGWECEGRLHVMKVLRQCGPSCIIGRHGTNKNTEDIINGFDSAIEAFKRAKKGCSKLGDDPMLQLDLHITWCGIYKCLTHTEMFEPDIQGEGKYRVEDTQLQLPPFVRSIKFKRVSPEKRDKKSLLDACLEDLANMQLKLKKSSRVKANLQANMAFYTLHALKEFNFNGDDIKASDYADKAIEIAKKLEIKTDVGVELNEQIFSLLENLFYVNFQFSAPKCPTANVNVYPEYVHLTFEGLDKRGSQNFLIFKIYYDPPPEEPAFENEITLVLTVIQDMRTTGEERLHIKRRKEEEVTSPVEFPCRKVKANLSYWRSADCGRQLHVKAIPCDKLQMMQ